MLTTILNTASDPWVTTLVLSWSYCFLFLALWDYSTWEEEDPADSYSEGERHAEENLD